MKTILFVLSSIILLNSGNGFLGCQNKSTDNNIENAATNATSSIPDYFNVSQIKATGKTVTPEMFGAIADGKSHKLSEKYSSLDAARNDYPGVKDLDITIDGAAFQKAVNMASLDNGEVLAQKKYVVNYPIVMKDNVIVDGNNKGIFINDRSRGKMMNWAFLFGDHAPYGFNKEENNGAGYDYYAVNESMKIGQNFLTLSNPADASLLKVNQIVMVVSSYKRKQNILKVMLPYHITMSKIVKMEGSKVFFEYPFDENVDSVEICANGNYDNHTGINFEGVQNVTLRNMTIDAAQISGSEYAYKCHIDHIRLINGVRLVGMNAMAYSTFTNITGDFSWRCIEIKTGTHNLLVRNIHGTYKPIDGYPQAVDAISLGQYNRNVIVDSFDINFGEGVPKISTINFRSRKGTISNGTIICNNLTSAFVKFYNEHYISDPLFGCYGNTIKNVKFYGGPDMKVLLEIADGEGVNKGQPKDNWVSQKKIKNRQNKENSNDDDEMDRMYDAPQTEDVPPQGNTVENCTFNGGSIHSIVKLNGGSNNNIMNCIFSNGKIKASPNYNATNKMSNNQFR